MTDEVYVPEGEKAHDAREVAEYRARQEFTPYLESMDEITFRIAYGAPKSRLTTYRGTEMRSRLERRFAVHLDATGERWIYEPRLFGGYLPDFEIRDLPQRTYIEVKPTLAEVREAAKRMEVIWREYPDALLIVACEEGCSFFAALAGGEWERWTERWS